MTKVRVEFDPPVNGFFGKKVSSSVFDDENRYGNPLVPALFLPDGEGNATVIKIEHEESIDADLAIGLSVLSGLHANGSGEIVRYKTHVAPGEVKFYTIETNSSSPQIMEITHTPTESVHLPHKNTTLPGRLSINED